MDCASQGGYCPCERARELGIVVEVADLPAGRMGEYDHASGRIVVSSRLPWPARRSTIAHEVVHAERGDDGTRVRTLLDDREVERNVDEIASRRLIPLERLAEAMTGGQPASEAAAGLGVDRSTLRARLDTLTAAEADYLRRRLD